MPIGLPPVTASILKRESLVISSACLNMSRFVLRNEALLTAAAYPLTLRRLISSDQHRTREIELTLRTNPVGLSRTDQSRLDGEKRWRVNEGEVRQRF
jgi:hypothetical protein